MRHCERRGVFHGKVNSLKISFLHPQWGAAFCAVWDADLGMVCSVQHRPSQVNRESLKVNKAGLLSHVFAP